MSDSENNGANQGFFGFLKDHDKQFSSMRVMNVAALGMSFFFGVVTTGFGCTINSCTISIPAISKNNDGVFITTAFLVAAFFPKLLQKLAESRFPEIKKAQEDDDAKEILVEISRKLEIITKAQEEVAKKIDENPNANG